MHRVFSLAVVVCLSQVGVAFALGVGTHKAINEHIANNSFNTFSLDAYLKRNLGMRGGKAEKFNNGSSRTCVGQNGVCEAFRPNDCRCEMVLMGHGDLA